MRNKIIGIFIIIMLFLTSVTVCGIQNEKNFLVNNNYILGTDYEFIPNNEMNNYKNDIFKQEWIINGYDLLSSINKVLNPLPSELDWRSHTYNGITGDWTTPAKSQGGCGSCWAFAAIGTLEAVINIANENPDLDMDLSEQYMVSCAPSQPGHPMNCSGGARWLCYKYMSEDTYPYDGALTESCFPYSATEEPCDNKCSDWRDNLVKRITSWGWSYPSNVNEIKSKLQYGPVALNMLVYEDFSSYTGGVYEHQWGNLRGGHSIGCVGYSDIGEYFICKNSWGSHWGENGFFRIKYDTCNIWDDLTWVTFVDIGENDPPNIPTDPEPEDHETDVDIDENIRWSCDDPDVGDILTYDIYFGTSNPPPLLTADYSSLSYNVGKMDNETTYYWKIVARDPYDETSSSPVWEFTTRGSENNAPEAFIDSINPNPANIGEQIDFVGHGEDSDGTIVAYYWESSIDGPLSTASSFSSSGLSTGTHNIYFKVQDDMDTWSSFTTESLFIYDNQPPEIPIISGPSSGSKGQTYTFNTSSTDPNDDFIFYWFDWGDGTNTDWVGPLGSGNVCSESKMFGDEDVFSIKVKAKDINGAESDWAIHEISIPKNKEFNIFDLFLDWLFERFPLLERIMFFIQ